MIVQLLSTGSAHLASGAVVLADNNFGDNSPDATAGPLGLFIVLALLAVTIFLVLNMTKRLKRLPASFDDDDASAGSDASATADDSAVMNDDAAAAGDSGAQASGAAAPSVAVKKGTRSHPGKASTAKGSAAKTPKVKATRKPRR